MSDKSEYLPASVGDKKCFTKSTSKVRKASEAIPVSNEATKNFFGNVYTTAVFTETIFCDVRYVAIRNARKVERGIEIYTQY